MYGLQGHNLPYQAPRIAYLQVSSEMWLARIPDLVRTTRYSCLSFPFVLTFGSRLTMTMYCHFLRYQGSAAHFESNHTTIHKTFDRQESSSGSSP